jgi:hypothetical protein
MTVTIGWHPGDDLRYAGFVILVRVDDGPTEVPLGHPHGFATPQEAEALVPFVHMSPIGPCVSAPNEVPA